MAASATLSSTPLTQLQQLEEELAQEVSTLPAALQTGNPALLVDYLATVFQPTDDQPLPKSAYADGHPSTSQAWTLFAQALAADINTPEAKAEAVAMKAAAARAKAEIAEIERTCWPPKSDLGFLPDRCSGSGRDSESLDLVSCNACSQTVMACRFAAHLGHCRGAAKLPSPAPSHTSTLHASSGGRAASLGRPARPPKGRSRTSRSAPIGKSNLSNGSNLARHAPATAQAKRPESSWPMTLWAAEAPSSAAAAQAQLPAEAEAAHLRFHVRHRRTELPKKARQIALLELPWNAPEPPQSAGQPGSQPCIRPLLTLQQQRPDSQCRPQLAARKSAQRTSLMMAGQQQTSAPGNPVKLPQSLPEAHGSGRSTSLSAQQAGVQPRDSPAQPQRTAKFLPQRQALAVSPPQHGNWQQTSQVPWAGSPPTAVPRQKYPLSPQQQQQQQDRRRQTGRPDSGRVQHSPVGHQPLQGSAPAATPQALIHQQQKQQHSQACRPNMQQAAPRSVPTHLERANRALAQQRVASQPGRWPTGQAGSSREGPSFNMADFTYPRGLPTQRPTQAQNQQHQGIQSQPLFLHSHRQQQQHPQSYGQTYGQPQAPIQDPQQLHNQQRAGVTWQGSAQRKQQELLQMGQHTLEAQQQQHPPQSNGHTSSPASGWQSTEQQQGHQATSMHSPDHEDSLLYNTPVNGYSQEDWRVGLPMADGLSQNCWTPVEALQPKELGEFGPQPSKKMGNLNNITHRLPKLPA